MTDFRSIDPSAERLVDAMLLKVKDQHPIRQRNSDIGIKLLERFETLRGYRNLYLHKTTELVGKRSSFIVLLLEKHLTIVRPRRTGTCEEHVEEVEPILLFSIPYDMGGVLIRLETVADRFADLFTKLDIDFADFPDFSSKYYVVGNNPDLVRKNLPKSLIECLDKVSGVTVEIQGNWGLIRTEKNLTEEVLLLLIGIGRQMTN